MSKSIRLSPNHGVNPTIPLCFWCGKQKNEIALMGKINRADDEAPRNCYLDYEPCDECKKNFDAGVAIIEASYHPNSDGQLPIVSDAGINAYPTGRLTILKPEAADRLWKNHETHKPGTRALMQKEDYEAVFGHLSDTNSET